MEEIKFLLLRQNEDWSDWKSPFAGDSVLCYVHDVLFEAVLLVGRWLSLCSVFSSIERRSERSAEATHRKRRYLPACRREITRA